MDIDLPYLAEYAKSSRSKCKACKTAIAASNLRIAIMVQSAFSDSKQPNWYHQNCFFEKQRPKTVGDIRGYENLTNEHQNEIKSKIETLTDVVLATGKGAKNKRGKDEGSNVLLKDYGIEYANSTRAACRGCNLKIMKNDVRIKKLMYDTESAKKYGPQPYWHHVDCFENLRDELGFFAGGDQLPGFEKLRKDDQKMVKNKIKPKTDVPEAKKAKIEKPSNAEDVEREKLMKEQNALFHEYKTHLRQIKDKSIIDKLLEHNNQVLTQGYEAKLDQAADLLTWGGLKRCKKCQGQFELGKNNYICKGNVSEWAKCMTIIENPPRNEVKFPALDNYEFDFFKNRNLTVSNRLFDTIQPSSSVAVKKEENAGPRVVRERPKLYNCEFTIIGKTKKPLDDLKKEIAKHGGRIVKNAGPTTFAAISNEEEVRKNKSRMQTASVYNVHVVREDFLDKVLNVTDIFEFLDKESICDWGKDAKARHELLECSQIPRPIMKSVYTKSGPSTVKLAVKNVGGAVDPDSTLGSIAHIYVDETNYGYNVVMTNIDIQTDKNSFYKMQLLESDKNIDPGEKRYWLFRSWGRIGTNIGGKKTQCMLLEDAKKEYMKHYEEKTGNAWGSVFEKIAGYYVLVDVEYDNKGLRDLETNNTNISSKLDKPLQDLIKLIFDVDNMNKTMLQFELDTEKMPLGKLSQRQLLSAYTVLSKLSELVTEGASSSEFIGPTNEFYSIIPHSFGIEKPPLIDTDEVIKKKIEMIDSLMEIEVAYSLLNSERDDNMNSIDQNYQNLNTDLDILDKSSEEFKLIQEYVTNSHADTHKWYDLEIEEVFKVTRKNESKRYEPFKHFHNRKLLWHGSRLTNWVGILSNGLRIAPPEAPCTGYMFGKGIYFADMVSKSANYCYTSKENNTGLLMLCEVALGNMLECSQSAYITKLPNGKHCTKGMGKAYPNPEKSYIRDDGVEIPLGSVITDIKSTVALLYNEFIVYDIAQVNCQYLIKMKFDHHY